MPLYKWKVTGNYTYSPPVSKKWMFVDFTVNFLCVYFFKNRCFSTTSFESTFCFLNPNVCYVLLRILICWIRHILTPLDTHFFLMLLSKYNCLTLLKNYILFKISLSLNCLWSSSNKISKKIEFFFENSSFVKNF